MKATPGAPVAAKLAQLSTYDSVRKNAFQAVNWIGRQVCYVGTTVKSSLGRIVNAVKPFFTTIAKVLCETVDRSKELISRNREIAVVGAISLVVGGGLFLALSKILGCDEESSVASV